MFDCGIPLAKYQSNAGEVLDVVTPSSPQEEAHSFDDCSTKILGLSWHPQQDILEFKSKPPNSGSEFTKRIILSETAK